MGNKILVVDDEKLIVKGIRFSLEQDGMEVTAAYDGEEALALAKSGEFDLILLDVMLPKLTVRIGRKNHYSKRFHDPMGSQSLSV